MLRSRALVLIVLLSATLLFAQNDIPNHVRGEMSFLASDALRGRGSATHDEFVAASYVAAQFQSFGLEAAEVQRVPLDAVLDRRLRAASSPAPSPTTPAPCSAAPIPNLPPRPSCSAPTSITSARAALPQGEVIYHGADDDASGTTAVLELARALSSLPAHPRRSILFVCFGSEETGGQGDQYFLAHPPLPLASIVANLEFEMIGQPDPAIRRDQLWLTGWERSNLGPALAKHGAPLAADPHPAQHFFQRSDNFALARQGIVAQTVSSYGLGAHYHQPSDDLAHIDFPHLTHAIEWMIAPIQWLANTDWKPSWNPGGKP